MKIPRSEKYFFSTHQALNRDLSIAIIAEHLTKSNVAIEVLDACTGSGARAIRYAQSLIEVSKLVAVDINMNSLDIAKNNAIMNGVPLIEYKCCDALIYMQTCPSSFSIIEIDPFGCSLPYIRAAVRCLKPSGILCLTFTNSNILFGNNSSFFASYGTTRPSDVSLHEFSLRAVIFSSFREIFACGRYPVPVACWSFSHGCRLIIKVDISPVENYDYFRSRLVYESIDGSYLTMSNCIVEKDGGYTSISKWRIYGPLWASNTCNLGLLQRTIAGLNSNKVSMKPYIIIF